MAQIRPNGMHREDIKAALRKKHGTLAALAKSWGLAQCAITDTLRDPVASTRVERMIANALGMKVQDIWPDRWDQQGTPLPRSSKTKNTRNDPAASSQNREAA
jgi:Ner family transcriptional regulator